MMNIEAPPELLALLASELGAGRSVDIPGLGTFSVEAVHAEADQSGDSLHIRPPSRSVRFVSERRNVETGG